MQSAEKLVNALLHCNIRLFGVSRRPNRLNHLTRRKVPPTVKFFRSSGRMSR